MISELAQVFIRKLDLIKVSHNIDVRKLLNFKEYGGNAVYDGVASEQQFLEQYSVVFDGVLYRNSKFKKEFDSFSKFDYSGVVSGPVPESFFKFRGMKYFLMLQDLKVKDDSSETDYDEGEEDIMTRDFLGIMGGTNLEPYDGSVKFDSYLKFVSGNFRKCQIVSCYRAYLNLHAEQSKVSSIFYDSPFDFILTAEKQFGYYIELFQRANLDNPGSKFYIYNDGVGIGSMVCIALGLPYVSFETYGIGTLAYKLGIITHASPVEYYEQKIIGKGQPEDIHFYGNLSNFYNLSGLIKGKQYIVVDENRLFTGCDMRDIKWSTHGRVFTNCIRGDDFVTFGREICRSLPMIAKKKNVPMSPKAEYFLLANDLQVYTDGRVKTITQPTSGGDFYIDVTDSVRDYKKLDCFISNYNPPNSQIDVLNIITRNRPLSDFGKNGDLKRYKFQEYEYGTHDFVVDDEIAFKIDWKKYKDPRFLHDFFFQDGLYFGAVNRPEYVRYLIEDGRKKYIMFMRIIKMHGKEYGVFRDRNAYSGITVDCDL